MYMYLYIYICITRTNHLKVFFFLPAIQSWPSKHPFHVTSEWTSPKIDCCARGIQQIPSFADFYDMGKEVMPSTHRYMKVRVPGSLGDHSIEKMCTDGASMVNVGVDITPINSKLWKIQVPSSIIQYLQANSQA